MYLVMEYCPKSLEKLKIQKKETGFTEKEILIMLRDVLSGLQHLHNLKIVHLDIKTGIFVQFSINFSENILLSKEGIFKIGDLGISRFSTYNCNEDIDEGDSRYLAPELLNDIYA